MIRFQKWYIFSALLFIGSCGPSIEEKARQLALRDSFSIDSALKKEAVVRRALLHKATLRKDSLRKAAHDSIQRRADSTKAQDSLPKSHSLPDNSSAN